MRNSEFIALMAANTNKTTHIRTYAGPWYTGASRVSDALTTQIGKIIALIQAKINEGQICDKDKECLLVYNFQSGGTADNMLFCNLDMLIKPLSEIHQTHQNVGRPLQLIVDGSLGLVMNNTKGMINLGLITEDEAQEEDLDAPVVYGSYKDFKAVCCFAALANYKPIKDEEELFGGKYDNSDCVQHCHAFDSLIEARQQLATMNDFGRYVLEVTAAKEDFGKVKEQGLSKQSLKVINYFDFNVKVTSSSNIRAKEDRIEDEIARLNEVKHENLSPMKSRRR